MYRGVLIAYHLSPATRITYHLSLTTYRPPLIIHLLRPTSYHPPLTYHRPLISSPTSHITHHL